MSPHPRLTVALSLGPLTGVWQPWAGASPASPTTGPAACLLGRPPQRRASPSVCLGELWGCRCVVGSSAVPGEPSTLTLGERTACCLCPEWSGPRPHVESSSPGPRPRLLSPAASGTSSRSSVSRRSVRALRARPLGLRSPACRVTTLPKSGCFSHVFEFPSPGPSRRRDRRPAAGPGAPPPSRGLCLLFPHRDFRAL